MITVDIIGGTKYQRSIAYKIIEHCHKALFPKIEKLYITVRLTNKIDVYGYCTELDNREFDLEIYKNLGLRQFVTTICHEMVHVKQKLYNHPYDENEAIDYESKLANEVWEADIL